jgi:hypothetical protein
VAAAERGTVAVTLSDARAQTSPDCTLPGAYTEVNGTGGGRFFATNRAILRTDEVDAKCRSATHLVAAYVTWRDAAVDRIAAILVPLPCPSASDPAPAPGCVGAGLTGPERAARAKPLTERLIANAAGKPMVLEALTAFALAPDQEFPLRFVLDPDPAAEPVFMYCFLDHFTPDSPWTPVARKGVR